MRGAVKPVLTFALVVISVLAFIRIADLILALFLP